jgi:hypothetical protein
VLRRLWSRWSDAIVIVKPETVIGWHRAGFALLRDSGTEPWKPAFAGIVTNGGLESVHFIDAAYVIGCLHTLGVGG